MTEEEWNAASDPTPMLRSLWEKASERKIRLFMCACCRRIQMLLPDEATQVGVALAEEYADGWATSSELNEANASIHAALQRLPDRSQSRIRAHRWLSPLQALAYSLAPILPVREGEQGAKWAAAAVGWAALDGMPAAVARRESRWRARMDAAQSEESKHQAALIRDIFGPLPFRPVALDPAWRTSTVLALAEGIYADRAFDRLPILADALMDAGCDNEEVLNHCRGDGPHVRGCWVVDLLTGRG